MESVLPSWAVELRDRYLSGEASVFLVHGNVRDLVAVADGDATRWDTMRVFLERFFRRTKDLVVHFNVSEGIEFPSKAAEEQFKRAVNNRRLMRRREPMDALPRSTPAALAAIEDVLTDPSLRAAVLLDYLETISPNADLAFMGEADKSTLVTLLRLPSDPALLGSDNILVLMAENLGEVHRRIVSSPHVALVHVPLPDADARGAFIAAQARDGIVSHVDDAQLVKITAGLSLSQIRGLFRQARQSGAPITFRLVNQRKKSIIEQECAGLVEFVDPHHGFAEVGGMDGVKAELMRIADAIKAGHRARVPMGLIFVGPMGTGKTFVAEAFARESGLTCLKFKNFREKWVGSTEANLERILQVVEALGYVLLIIDEADRSIGGTQSDNDGGTSSRVIARLKEFMSDTRHRGRVVILMMTNRPDKLDADLKRPGRFDVKVPFFFPETDAERRQIVDVLVRRAGLTLEEDADLQLVASETAGRSAAEIEAVVIAAGNFAAWEDRARVSQADLRRAVQDVVPTRDTRMVEYMELLAVFEASARRMLPARLDGLATAEVQARLDRLRAMLGARVA